MSNSLYINDFGKICRTCLAKGEMQSLYEKRHEDVSLSEMIMFMTFVRFSVEDGLPEQICLNCVSELNKAYDFAQKCSKVDKQLRKCLKESESKVKQTLGRAEIQIKTEIDIEEHEIESIFIKDENFTQNEIDNNIDSDFSHEFENNLSDSCIDDEINEENCNSTQNELPTIKVKQKIPKIKAVSPYKCKICLEQFGTYRLLLLHWKEMKHSNRNNSKISSKSITPTNIDQYMKTNSEEGGVVIASGEKCQVKNSCSIEKSAENMIMPDRSKSKYVLAYQRFEKWCNENEVENNSDQNVLLTYFEHLSKTQKPNSLWAYYSMLASIISKQKNIDIRKYTNLKALLKKKSKGFQVKQPILMKHHVDTFLHQADDNKFLLIKVALIVGIAGAFRREELANLSLENVKDEGHFFHFVLPNIRTKMVQQFFITSGNMIEIVRKYICLRPKHTNHNRFFVGYRNGKCTTLHVGVNTFGSMPKIIASFLKLANPEQYTGHCFRRSSTSWLAGHTL